MTLVRCHKKRKSTPYSPCVNVLPVETVKAVFMAQDADKTMTAIFFLDLLDSVNFCEFKTAVRTIESLV